MCGSGTVWPASRKHPRSRRTTPRPFGFGHVLTQTIVLFLLFCMNTCGGEKYSDVRSGRRPKEVSSMRNRMEGLGAGFWGTAYSVKRVPLTALTLTLTRVEKVATSATCSKGSIPLLLPERCMDFFFLVPILIIPTKPHHGN